MSNKLTCSTAKEESSERRDMSSSGCHQEGDQSWKEEAFEQEFTRVC